MAVAALVLQVNYDYFDGRPNSENVGGGAGPEEDSLVLEHLTSSRR